MPDSGILREMLIGGLVLGGIGVLLGAWLGISYGRERGRAPTGFVVLFYWLLFGAPGFIIGGLVGALVYVIALALPIEPPDNLSAFVVGGLCAVILTGLAMRPRLRQSVALKKLPVSPGEWSTRFSKLPPVQYRPTDLQVKQASPLRIVAAAYNLAHFSPDGRWLLTGAGDQAFVWDTHTLSVKQKFKKISKFAFSQDSLHLAVYQPSDRQVQVVELPSGKVTDRIFGRNLPTGQISSLSFHPTAPALVISAYSAHNHAALDRYDRMKQAGTTSSVTRPAFGRRRALERAQKEQSEAQASQRAAQKEQDWILDRENERLIDGATGETVQRLDGWGKLGHVEISPDGLYVAGIDYQQKTLRIRDLETGKVITHSDERFQAGAKLTFSPDSAVLLVRSDCPASQARRGILFGR